MSYSQNSEELHIARIVGDQPGRFLDIGAYNPKLFSNTRALYERGWSGVMVEASPGPFMDLLIEYGKCDRVELVCAAVTAKRGLVRFNHSEAGVGTSNEAHYQKWRDKAEFSGRFFAAGIALQDLTNMFGIDFDFVNIDIEGDSSGLFLNALIDHRLRPKCWCVEHDGRQEQMTKAALLQGYTQYHLNGENVIYARQNG
jgi:FkbM family methyltransferase